jgi:hypothetical protein
MTINPATDCETPSPSDWARMNRRQLEVFASKGNPEQKTALIDWGYAGLPAWFFEELFFLATGEEWTQD